MLSWISKKTKLKKSHVFWLGIGFLAQIIIGFISLELLGFISAIGSLAAMGDMFDDSNDEFPWQFWFPITWFLFAILGILHLLYLIFRKPAKFIFKFISNQFEKFNNKLNQD